MNNRLFKEDLFFMIFSIFALGAAAGMGQNEFGWENWQEHLKIVLDFVASEIPHTY